MFISLLSLNSDHVMSHLGGYTNIVVFVHTSMQSVVCDKLHNCNLPNESSHDLNWVAKRM